MLVLEICFSAGVLIAIVLSCNYNKHRTQTDKKERSATEFCQLKRLTMCTTLPTERTHNAYHAYQALWPLLVVR